jgi:isopenicillin-N epimerase
VANQIGFGETKMTKYVPTTSSSTDVEKAREAVDEAAERIQIARREFVKLFGYGAAGLMMGGLSIGKNGMPELIPVAHASSKKNSPNTMNAPAGSPYASAFQFAGDLLYMNIGTTGSSPIQVISDFNLDYQDIASNPTAYLFGQQQMRNTIAPGFGCDPYELVLSFNTTDGLWRIMMGIPFQEGDEIITTNMEEDSGRSAVNMLVDRFRVVRKVVNIPTNDAYSDQEVIRRLWAQRSNKIKAIQFSSPIYLTGGRLPEKALCQLAARHHVVSIVDGAHQPGMNAINLHDMGCDFFAGSGHKWQCGPGQTGFLYIRNGYNPHDYVRTAPTDDYAVFGVPPVSTVDIPVPGYTNTSPLPTYFPTNTLVYGEGETTILQGGIRRPDDNIAAILQFIGNGSRPSQDALTECCQMWDEWGRQNIEDYIVSLAQYLRAKIKHHWGPQSLSLLYPYPDENSMAPRTGLTSFNPFSPNSDYNADLTEQQSTDQANASAAAVSTLKSQYNIVVRNNSVPHSLRSDPTQNAAPGTYSSPLRISTHLFHSTADVDDRLIPALLAVVPPNG